MKTTRVQVGQHVLYDKVIWQVERVNFLTVELVRDTWTGIKEETRVLRSQLLPRTEWANQLAFDLTAK